MNLSRCANGHFFDQEKFPTCPHCVGGAGNDDSNTVAYSDSNALGWGNGMVQNNFGFGGGFKTAELNADDMTEPLIGGQEPTVPVGGMEDEDDSTIGIFPGEIFGGNKVPMGGNVSPNSKKAGTPCVGWLVAISGEHIGMDYRLKVGKNFIGRDASMDVALTNDMSVSRNRHAEVVYEPKAHRYFVQSGDSSSLVYKNNEIVLTPMEIEAYDMITVGEVNLLFMPLCGEKFNWSTLIDEMKNRK